MAKQKIKLVLEIDEVNLILETLGKEPFVTVYQVISSIQEQAQQQLNETVPPAHAGDDSNLLGQSSS